MSRLALSARLPVSWTTQHDAQLLQAAGKYARIEALARQWGVAERVLLARWHRLRGSAPVGKRPDLDKAPLSAGRTQWLRSEAEA
ncbi:MAG: hypothetical protein GYB53_22605 [Rhodobacteraceae bacterium]|uniref:Uncharacterized protein n=1 Tax=Roseovarius nubinhibens TaxID=314263 RepID=A0A348W771_9RHOB|nr:hypothetical protein [Paracoccaceae bacterium]HAR50383.1 hypothetical protein [Roseovarius nubinhibens]|tara:strand:- start:5009 stop:5263 length:255 start_codon:yes stop_codon:yes gene_type:complete